MWGQAWERVMLEAAVTALGAWYAAHYPLIGDDAVCLLPFLHWTWGPAESPADCPHQLPFYPSVDYEVGLGPRLFSCRLLSSLRSRPRPRW